MEHFFLFATINIIIRLTKQVKRPSNHQFSCTSLKTKLENNLPSINYMKFLVYNLNLCSLQKLSIDSHARLQYMAHT